MDNSKRKTLKRYSLENVEGIGPSKAKKLMNQFKTLSALREANASELMKVKGISEKDAKAVIEYLKNN